jgi:anaerobic magnesium-protoporphyrin IX monomethyl ester cyclase
MAYPGAKLHTAGKEKGYPLPARWGQYGFFEPHELPLRNDNLSAEDILRFRDNAFIEYFSSQRYRSMISENFGEQTVDFIRNKVLSKNIVRTRYEE